MSEKIQAPRGTFDVLPADEAARSRLLHAGAGLFERAGYGRIETPVFEDTALFARTVGEATDIVSKEMFTFEDRGGRSITLRPEGTAPICRAYVEHGMHKLAQPVKLWYIGPYFRYEAPQAGRFRQFNQIGAEAIGSESPVVDAELIGLLHDLLADLGVPSIDLRLGSLGSPESRVDYREELKAYLRENEGDLAKEVVERIETNPLRAFDSADPGTQAVMEHAPTMLNRLEGEDAAHFDEVRALLDQAGIAYSLDPTLVRGLDYYTRTIFEFHCDQLGAQSQLGGGGRYDRLVAGLGGPETPGVGFAAGVERILLSLAEEPPEPSCDAFVATAGEGQYRRAAALVGELRKAGLSAQMDLANRSLKGQLKQADRLGARKTLIVGEDGTLELKDMESGEQSALDPAKVVEAVGDRGAG